MGRCLLQLQQSAVISTCGSFGALQTASSSPGCPGCSELVNRHLSFYWGDNELTKQRHNAHSWKIFSLVVLAQAERISLMPIAFQSWLHQGPPGCTLAGTSAQGKSSLEEWRRHSTPPAAGKCELECLIEFWESLHFLFVPLCTGKRGIHTLEVLQSSSQKDTISVSPQIISLQESKCLDQRRAEQIKARLRVKARKSTFF